MGRGGVSRSSGARRWWNTDGRLTTTQPRGLRNGYLAF